MECQQALSAKQIESDLKKELDTFTSVESESIEVNEKVKLAQKQKRVANKKAELLNDIIALRDQQTRAQPDAFETPGNIINQLKLVDLENQIAILNQEIKGVCSLRDETTLTIETRRNTDNKLANKEFEENTKRLENETQKLLDPIKQSFLADLSRAIA